MSSRKAESLIGTARCGRTTMLLGTGNRFSPLLEKNLAIGGGRNRSSVPPMIRNQQFAENI